MINLKTTTNSRKIVKKLIFLNEIDSRGEMTERSTVLNGRSGELNLEKPIAIIALSRKRKLYSKKNSIDGTKMYK